MMEPAFAVGGHLDNTGRGEIGLGGDGQTTSLLLTSNTTLSGGGSVVMDQNSGSVVVTATNSSIVLTNLDNTISGGGSLGDGRMILINKAAGTIDAGYGDDLIIDTGSSAVHNAGLIETTTGALGGAGTMVVESALQNNGTITADGASLTAEKAVTGSGQATIGAGTLDFELFFNQNVTFTGTTGVLELGRSAILSGGHHRFLRRRRDVARTARQRLRLGPRGACQRDFTVGRADGQRRDPHRPHHPDRRLSPGSTFVSSSDGLGSRVTIVGQGSGGASAPAAHRMVAAMAALGGSAAATTNTHTGDIGRERPTLLAGPRAMTA